MGDGLRILITGGEGFIGSATSEKLVEKGHQIVSFDYRKQNDYVNYSSNVDFKKVDLRDYNSISKNLKKIDGVIHLGAVSRVIWGEDNPQACIDINVKGTLNLLEFVKKSNIKPWFLFGSSRCVYGETNGEGVPETSSFNPKNIYGISKVAAERLTESYAIQNNLRALSLRFSNVYGKLSDVLDRVIPRFIINCLLKERLEIHGGNQIFDFTHIDDAVNGILLSIDYLDNLDDEKTQYDAFNIMPGKGNTLHNLIEIMQNNFDHQLESSYTPNRSYDIEKFVGNPNKAEKVLGFKCNIDLDEGVNKTVKLFTEEFQANKVKLLSKFREDSKFEL